MDKATVEKNARGLLASIQAAAATATTESEPRYLEIATELARMAIEELEPEPLATLEILEEIAWSKDRWLLFREAVDQENVERVDLLIRLGVDPSGDDNYAITVAHDCLPLVERLLQDRRVDPSAYNNHAIRMASLFGNTCVVNRLLQDERVDPSVHNYWPVREAVAKGHLSVVEQLLRFDIPQTVLHELMKIAETGDCEYLRVRLLRLLSQYQYLH